MTIRKKIREYSDRVCLVFGIQPIMPTKEIGKPHVYNKWVYRRKGLIATVKNLDELLYELESIGYTVKRGKYISVKAPGQQRFVRTKTLGEDYTEESLISRIRWRNVGTNIDISDKPAPIRDDYIRTLNDVTELARSGRKVQRKRFASEPYSPENDIDVYKLSAQLSIINRDNIHSIGELDGKIQRLKEEYENARQEINSLAITQERLDGLIEQAKIYFEFIDKPDLSVSEQLRLKICKQTLKSNNISNRADFDRLKDVQQETDKKIATLKNSFENCKQMYDVYTDIAKTCNDISNGDYVSKHVAKKRKIQKHSVNIK